MPEKSLAQELVVGALGGALPSILVYWLTARTSKNAFKRQVAVNDIAGIIERIDRAEAAAQAYYLLKGDSPLAVRDGISLNSAVKAITSHVSQLRQSHAAAELHLPTTLSANFRKALTGSPFQEASRPAYEPSDIAFSKISNAADDLKSALRRCRDQLK